MICHCYKKKVIKLIMVYLLPQRLFNDYEVWAGRLIFIMKSFSLTIDILYTLYHKYYKRVSHIKAVFIRDVRLKIYFEELR